MRVMLDTNVIVSAAIFSSPTIWKVIEDARANHETLVPAYAVEEFRRTVARKWPSRMASVESFLEDPPFRVVPGSGDDAPPDFEIRDPKDVPILAAALSTCADVLVTGDKDFLAATVEGIEIVTPAQYVSRYIRR